MAKKNIKDIKANIGGTLRRSSRISIIPTPDAEKKLAAFNSINAIPIDEIEPNPNNPRLEFRENAILELSESIKRHGLIQPITVRKKATGGYTIISGERRFRAAQKAALKQIPAYIRDIEDDQTLLELALIENIQREDLLPLEVAMSYQRLMRECNWNQEELAEKIKKSRITITHTLGLLRLPPSIIAGLNEKIVTPGHVKGLISLGDKVDHQLYLYNKIVEDQLSVRDAEKLIKQYKESILKKQKSNVHQHQDYIDQGIKDLSAFFGAKTDIRLNAKGKGKITIPVKNFKALEYILEKIDK